MSDNEIIEVFECAVCHEQYRGKKAKKKARQCKHEAVPMRDLTYQVGTHFRTSEGKIVKVTGTLDIVFYLLDWEDRKKTRRQEQSIEDYLASGEWTLLED